MRELLSPNHDARPEGRAVELLVLHYTGMPSTAAALERLCAPGATVSAHYLIDEEGAVYRLVPEERRAWHAGAASWRGIQDVNAASIGIELANPGHEWGYRPFTQAQMAALESLAREILARHSIPPRNVVGHSDVAPGRKTDPGELFRWKRLARAGIGLWPPSASKPSAKERPLAQGDSGPEVARLQHALAAFGYGLETDGRFDEATRAVVEAFQRHFRPRRIDGIADPETRALLVGLLDLVT